MRNFSPCLDSSKTAIQVLNGAGFIVAEVLSSPCHGTVRQDSSFDHCGWRSWIPSSGSAGAQTPASLPHRSGIFAGSQSAVFRLLNCPHPASFDTGVCDHHPGAAGTSTPSNHQPQDRGSGSCPTGSADFLYLQTVLSVSRHFFQLAFTVSYCVSPSACSTDSNCFRLD